MGRRTTKSNSDNGTNSLKMAIKVGTGAYKGYKTGGVPGAVIGGAIGLIGALFG